MFLTLCNKQGIPGDGAVGQLFPHNLYCLSVFSKNPGEKSRDKAFIPFLLGLMELPKSAS